MSATQDTLALIKGAQATPVADAINKAFTQGTGLVDRAGQTMQQVVAGIREVSEIVGQINTASGQQSEGLSSVVKAIADMDQVTQQNAALVEEMAAAASSLESQAQGLLKTVAVFRLEGALEVQPAT